MERTGRGRCNTQLDDRVEPIVGLSKAWNGPAAAEFAGAVTAD